MFKFYHKIVLQQFKGVNRITPLTWNNGLASATIAEPKNINGQNVTHDEKPTEPHSKPTNRMIKTVFASIALEDSDNGIHTPFTDSKLLNAKSVDELLSISEGSGVSRKHAMKVSYKFGNFLHVPRFLCSAVF